MINWKSHDNREICRLICSVVMRDFIFRIYFKYGRNVYVCNGVALRCFAEKRILVE